MERTHRTIETGQRTPCVSETEKQQLSLSSLRNFPPLLVLRSFPKRMLRRALCRQEGPGRKQGDSGKTPEASRGGRTDFRRDFVLGPDGRSAKRPNPLYLSGGYRSPPEERASIQYDIVRAMSKLEKSLGPYLDRI